MGSYSHHRAYVWNKDKYYGRKDRTNVRNCSDKGCFANGGVQCYWIPNFFTRSGIVELVEPRIDMSEISVKEVSDGFNSIILPPRLFIS